MELTGDIGFVLWDVLSAYKERICDDNELIVYNVYNMCRYGAN